MRREMNAAMILDGTSDVAGQDSLAEVSLWQVRPCVLRLRYHSRVSGRSILPTGLQLGK